MTKYQLFYIITADVMLLYLDSFVMSLDQLSLYKSAFKFRYIETLISKEYSRGFIRCPTHLSVGQEILPSLLVEFSDNSDFAVSTRSHYHYFSKGGSISAFLMNFMVFHLVVLVETVAQCI